MSIPVLFRFTFITRIAEEGRASPPIRVVGVNDPRLTPVPESGEPCLRVLGKRLLHINNRYVFCPLDLDHVNLYLIILFV